MRPPADPWAEERAARARGARVIAGIDEAGRGPLAGPVVAACVVLPFEADMPGVRDSKALSPEQRDRAFERIRASADAVGVGIAQVEEIDSLNILRATHLAMRRALDDAAVRPDLALIDGLPVNPFPAAHRALVKGDSRSVSIAAASIIAKVTRDRLMVEQDAVHPGYGFAAHKGYCTPEHLEALARLGPCAAHRRSFAPVAQMLNQPALPLDGPTRHETGEDGERIVAAHCRGLGWEVLATRYRCRGGELDVVARDGDALVFMEVKSRRGRTHGEPAESVDARKRARLLVAAESYLAESELGEPPCRFDVAEVRFSAGGLATVHLIRNAFMAGE